MSRVMVDLTVELTVKVKASGGWFGTLIEVPVEVTDLPATIR